MPVENLLYKNYNAVYLDDKIIKKKFLSNMSFEAEIEFYDVFSQYLNVPKRLGVDRKEHVIYYTFIEGETLDKKEVLDSLSAKEIFALRERIPRLNGAMKENALTPIFGSLNFTPELVHGDFRLENIIISKSGEFYVIDFEAGNYFFREFDDAYMFISLLRTDKEKANDYMELLQTVDRLNRRFFAATIYFVNGV
ncbi:MAG: hypothetical protein ACP5K3_03820, partial [Candidatus Micrarchaeia archaeon]